MTRRPSIKYTQEQWQHIFEDQQQSGLTIKKYCEEKKITLSSYYHWKNKLAPIPKKNISDVTNAGCPDWLPLTIPAPTANVKPHWDIELDLPSGITLRMRAS